MLPAKIRVFLTAVVDFAFGGLLSNGFITAVIISEWTKSRSLAASGQLLLSLGLSNICASVIIALNIYTLNVTTTYNTSLMGLFHQGFSFWIGFMRYWLTAWLCSFYCIKVVNCTRPFFLWWKMRISRLMPRLIVGSCFYSFLTSIFMELFISRELQSKGTANITNITQERRMELCCSYYKQFCFVLGSSPPFLIVFLCSVLVIFSLCQHISQMTSKGSNFKSIQIEVHVKAARTVFSLLFLYIFFYVAQSMNLILYSQEQKKSVLATFFVMLMYAPVQATILVLSNSKLKQTASWVVAGTKS